MTQTERKYKMPEQEGESLTTEVLFFLAKRYNYIITMQQLPVMTSLTRKAQLSHSGQQAQAGSWMENRTAQTILQDGLTIPKTTAGMHMVKGLFI